MWKWNFQEILINEMLLQLQFYVQGIKRYDQMLLQAKEKKIKDLEINEIWKWWKLWFQLRVMLGSTREGYKGVNP